METILSAFFATLLLSSARCTRAEKVAFIQVSGRINQATASYITLASDVAAMAPNTSIGAAHPVAVGGRAEKTNDTIKQKLLNFTVSCIRIFALKRGRTVEWPKSADVTLHSLPEVGRRRHRNQGLSRKTPVFTGGQTQ